MSQSHTIQRTTSHRRDIPQAPNRVVLDLAECTKYLQLMAKQTSQAKNDTNVYSPNKQQQVQDAQPRSKQGGIGGMALAHGQQGRSNAQEHGQEQSMGTASLSKPREQSMGKNNSGTRARATQGQEQSKGKSKAGAIASKLSSAKEQGQQQRRAKAQQRQEQRRGPEQSRGKSKAGAKAKQGQ